MAGLRASGYDVLSVHESYPSIADERVLALALQHKKILVTFDKDFGQLNEELEFARRCGVILLRLPTAPRATLAKRIVDAVPSRDDWEGKFRVVEPGRIRTRL